jgi:hypothetical protein
MTIRSWGLLSIALKFAALSIPPSRLCLRPGLLPVRGCRAYEGAHLQRYPEPCEYSRESDRGAGGWRRQFLWHGALGGKDFDIQINPYTTNISTRFFPNGSLRQLPRL